LDKLEEKLQRDLELLLDLQEIDDQLGELERSKIYLPEMIQKLESELSNLDLKIEETQNMLQESITEQKSLELEIESDKEQLEKYQVQMRVIKTNKEYDALMAEIDSKKLNVAEKEERVLALMSTIDECKTNLEEMNKSLEDVREGNSEQLKLLNEQSDNLQSKITDRLEKRNMVAKDIKRQIIGLYERVRKGKGGLVVVPIRKRACGGCFKQIPPQRVQEIRRGDRIFSCDSCGRILIWSEEDSN
jgi:predicted  nucleic acid-binding Zn-ribbon protein